MGQKEITFDKFIRWTGIILLIVFVLYALNYLSAVLIPFFVAWVFAYLLYPVVKIIENKLHVRIRALSIILTFIVVIAVLTLLVYLLIPPMIEQFGKLYDILSRWLHHTTHTNNITAWISDRFLENQEAIQNFLKSRDFTDAIKTAAPKLFNFVSQTASIVLSIVASMITLLYTFFILLDYEYLTTNWIRIFPKKNRPFWRVLAKDVERELNNYIRGQGTVEIGRASCRERV